MTGDLDIAAVDAWLSAHMAGYSGPATATRIAGGQSNPTFRLQTPAAGYVLRRKPPGELLKSAHAVDREFRVQRALSGSAVPVPAMHVLCEDDTVTGAAFYVMEAIDGRQFDDPRLPDLTAPERGAVYDEMNRVLSAIHDTDLAATGLQDFGPHGSYYRRQIDRWTRQYHASATEPTEDMLRLIAWLDRNCPEDDGLRTLVHGDYRIDNLLFAHDGPACVAVLDWELSTVGHPYADLAAVLMQWRMPPGPDGRGLAGVDRASLGLPSDAAFIDAYCDRRGIARIGNFNVYLAFCFFRMAAILEGVRRRALDGNASDPERGLKLGAMVPVFARQGLEAAGA